MSLSRFSNGDVGVSLASELRVSDSIRAKSKKATENTRGLDKVIVGIGGDHVRTSIFYEVWSSYAHWCVSNRGSVCVTWDV